ncbi:MAG TPA: hypothetical protein VE913_04435 [Longimicrobium sp.]|nr:hypothetical protein [Longimicrobium sp.]
MSWSATIWAGFVASVLAASVFWLFRNLNLTQFSPTSMLGCIFHGEPRVPLTETVGLVLYMLLGGTLVAAAYGWLMAALGGVGWDAGVVVGAVHGAATVAALPWFGRANRCVKKGRVPAPGAWGLGWGAATPPAVVLGHMAYGGVLGAVMAGFLRGGV